MIATLWFAYVFIYKGPWPDYPTALDDAMAAAERWIDSQLP
jgi:hypothetical protein